MSAKKAELKDIEPTVLFKYNALVYLAYSYEMFALTEPTSIKVPVRLCLQICDFKFMICACGFYHIRIE
jgi:hypothetical protein